MTQELTHKPKQLPKNARTQRAVFAYMYFNPRSTLKQVAKAIGVSHLSARLAWSRLKAHHDITKLCPECFSEALYDGVCHNCGFVAEQDVEFEPLQQFQEEHETVYNLKKEGLKLKSNAAVIQNFLDHGFKGHRSERKFERLKEKLKNQLMNYSNTPEVEAIALRILNSEYRKFRTDYPELLSKHGTDDLIVRNVLKRLRPWLAPLRSQKDDVSEFHFSDLSLK